MQAVYLPINISAMLNKAFHDWQFTRHSCAPQRRYVVNGAIVRHLVFSPLFDVCITNSDEVLHNFNIALLAGYE